jgi:ATP adenylyltransferase
MEYILGEKEKECIFCVALTDEANLTLYKGALSMVMMNKYPYINGHPLVSPKRHISTLDE